MKEAKEKEQHVCKLHTYRYIINISKQDTIFLMLAARVFVDKTIFFEQRKFNNYKTAIKVLD